MDLLPGLAASSVGVFVTELGQKTHCVLYFPVVYFSCFYFCLSLDVRTLTRTSQTSYSRFSIGIKAGTLPVLG